MNQEPLLSAFTRLRDNLLSMSNSGNRAFFLIWSIQMLRVVVTVRAAASFSLLILFRIGHSLQKASCIASEASSSF